MVTPQASGPNNGLAADYSRQRELLRRWLRLSREVLGPEDLLQLFDDTRRALGAEPTARQSDSRDGPT
jgi:hypothetical protein